MKFLGNLLWLIFGGLVSALSLFLTGLLCCITVVLIPIGIQLFKLAEFSLSPFGKKVTFTSSTGKTIINVIYAILFGWILALGEIVLGIALMVTIIGIPFGLQYFKMATFVFMPLGAKFE